MSIRITAEIKIGCCRLFSLCVSLAVFAISTNASGEDLKFTVSSDLDIVYNWKQDKCSETTIPDSPARAYRQTDGSIILFAAHFDNIPFVGADFDHLKPQCGTKSQGGESADPEKYDTRYWIQALIPNNSGNMIGIASHEYLGSRFGKCYISARNACWYSSIIAVVSNPNMLEFSTAALSNHVIAAPPFKYSPNITSRTGFFSTSNAIRIGEFHYLAIWKEFGRQKGTCLFRTNSANSAVGWKALKDGRFDVDFSNIHTHNVANSEDCDVVTSYNLRSIVFHVKSKTWIAVTMSGNNPEDAGVYYLISKDLKHWSSPQILYHAVPWWIGRGCGVYYEYPSLIDEESTSDIFDTTGDNLYLYLTQASWPDCKTIYNRNLVKIHLKISIN